MKQFAPLPPKPDEKEVKELEQCTFKPKINSLNPQKAQLYGIGVKQNQQQMPKSSRRAAKQQQLLTEPSASSSIGQPGDNAGQQPVIQKLHRHLEQILENDVPKQMPKGYAKVVERLRKHKEAQEKFKADEELKVTGGRYAKEKLDKMKPPSFLGNPGREPREQRRRNQLLLSIEVSISPHK